MEKTQENIRKAPPGKTRIIGSLPFNESQDRVIDDFDKREVAVEIAEKHNKKLRGLTDEVYLLYDDDGKPISEAFKMLS